MSQDIKYGRYAYKYGDFLFYYIPDNPAKRPYVLDYSNTGSYCKRQKNTDSEGKRMKHRQDADKVIFFRDIYAGYATFNIREKIFMSEHGAFGIAGCA